MTSTTAHGSFDDGRRAADLVGALARVRRRVVDAALAAGRSPTDVALIAITKGFPGSDLRTLIDLGVLDVGESRDQEARAKLAELTADGLGRTRLHFVGQLQTNKARSVARYAWAVQSLDRIELARVLSSAAEQAERELVVLLQVNLDEHADAGRGGVAPDQLLPLAAAVAQLPGLALRGLMAVAPHGGDADAAFSRLQQLAAQLQAEHPQATAISAGMSDDLEQAVRHGATYVRVGSALLGHRRPPIG